MANVEYFLQNLEFLLLGSPDPLKRGAYFGLLFNEAPTYQEINSGTPNLAPFIKLKDKFQPNQLSLVPNCDPDATCFEHFMNWIENLRLAFYSNEGKIVN